MRTRSVSWLRALVFAGLLLGPCSNLFPATASAPPPQRWPIIRPQAGSVPASAAIWSPIRSPS
jgi:hypothetical protein